MAAMLASGVAGGAQPDQKAWIHENGWTVTNVVTHNDTGDTVATIQDGRLIPGKGMTQTKLTWFDGRVDDAFDDGIFITCDSAMNILEIISY